MYNRNVRDAVAIRQIGGISIPAVISTLLIYWTVSFAPRIEREVSRCISDRAVNRDRLEERIKLQCDIVRVANITKLNRK